MMAKFSEGCIQRLGFLGAFDAVQKLVIREFGLNAEQVYPHPVFRYPALI